MMWFIIDQTIQSLHLNFSFSNSVMNFKCLSQQAVSRQLRNTNDVTPFQNQFVVDDVSKIIKEAIESTIGGNSYQHDKVNNWTGAVVENCLSVLTKQQKPYKYIGKFEKKAWWVIVDVRCCINCAALPHTPSFRSVTIFVAFFWWIASDKTRQIRKKLCRNYFKARNHPWCLSQRAQLKTFFFFFFHLQVTCMIMQKNGAGLHTASSCYWNNDTDGSCTVRWENKSMYCICRWVHKATSMSIITATNSLQRLRFGDLSVGGITINTGTSHFSTIYLSLSISC